MIEAYRLLVARLERARARIGIIPIHLGVTEAGDGEDGRIKSAIGIGSLLCDGIGDTIRVSLTEDSVHEIPVAQALVAPFNAARSPRRLRRRETRRFRFDPFSYRAPRNAARSTLDGVAARRRGTDPRRRHAQANWDKVAHKLDQHGRLPARDRLRESRASLEVDPRDDAAIAALNASPTPQLVTVHDGLDLPVIAAFRLLAAQLDERHPDSAQGHA